jgi:hypothetical protein
LDLLIKGSNVAVIIQCGGLWFANGKFGITWKLSQAIVQRKQSFALNGQCLIQLNSSDTEKLKKAPTVESTAEVEMASKVAVEDSDDEEEVEEEEDDDEVEEEDDAPTPAPVFEVVVPPPAPAPAPVVVEATEPATVKKRVVKKKTTA